jgi:hypothetical protein
MQAESVQPEREVLIMRFFSRKLLWVVVSAALLALTSCAITGQARKVERSGFLGGDGERLEPQDRSYSPLLGYFDEDANWRSYDKMWLAPVTLWGAAEDSFGSNEQDRKRLVQNFYGLLHREFSKDYQMVSEPGSGTLAARVAVTEGGKPTPVLDTVTSIVPQTRVATTLGGYATGKPAFTGAIQMEFKVNDSLTGALLAAGIDKRVGEKRMLDSFDSWSDVDDAMAFWAQQARFRLCRLRGDSNCVEPKSGTTL